VKVGAKWSTKCSAEQSLGISALDLTSGSVFAAAYEFVSDNSVFRYISDFDLVKVGAKFEVPV
jgi:hypothetical protein